MAYSHFMIQKHSFFLNILSILLLGIFLNYNLIFPSQFSVPDIAGPFKGPSDREVLEVVDRFPHLGNIIGRTGKIDKEVGNRINKGNIIHYHICNSLINYWNERKTAKLYFYKALNLQILTYVIESWIMLKHIRCIMGAKMKYHHAEWPVK